MTRAIGSYKSPNVRYALTRIRGTAEKRVYFRRDANCPAIALLRVRHYNEHFAAVSHLVNIAEDGCLLSSYTYPWRDDPLHDGRIEGLWFPRIADEVRVHIPWTNSTIDGAISKQGNYTLHIAFTDLLPSGFVDYVASLNPETDDAQAE